MVETTYSDDIPGILKQQAPALSEAEKRNLADNDIPDILKRQAPVIKVQKVLEDKPPVDNVIAFSNRGNNLSLKDFSEELTVFDLILWKKFLYDKFIADISASDVLDSVKDIYLFISKPAPQIGMTTLEFEENLAFPQLFQNFFKEYKLPRETPPKLILSLYRMLQNSAKNIQPVENSELNLEELFYSMKKLLEEDSSNQS